MTSPCLGCGKPTVNRYNDRPCCYRCEDCAESALFRLALIAARRPQMVARCE